ncbi:uncharacterized protein V6R79_005049 [Siganus canaliculatus]
MLAKILEDMWVEPEVLEALSEEQKRILFLKMREEQVRRWKVREEREEREGRRDAGPKKAYCKHVTWLLGRDGDVSVSVIGEVDEFRSSRLLQNLMNNRVCGDNMNGIQTADLLPGREAQRLGFKEDIQLTSADEDTSSPSGQSSEEEMDSCGADDDLKDPPEDSDSESGSSLDSRGEWAPRCRTHLGNHGNLPPLKAQHLSGTERMDRDSTQETSQHGGRAAQLKTPFRDDPRSKKPACTKPPLPEKPAHLQRRTEVTHL